MRTWEEEQVWRGDAEASLENIKCVTAPTARFQEVTGPPVLGLGGGVKAGDRHEGTMATRMGVAALAGSEETNQL